MDKKNDRELEQNLRKSIYRFGLYLGLIVVMALIVVFLGLWKASNQILFPALAGISKDFKECNSDAETNFGKFCGNIRLSKQYKYQEIKIPSINGYELPGWLIPARENGKSVHKGVVIFVHGGGSDRREFSRFIPFYLHQGFDIISFDLSCHGEAPCLFPGLSFGSREFRDVLSAYLYTEKKYQNIIMVGSSVGASSLLISLPFLKAVKGLVLENPMLDFKSLILESPESANLPNWMLQSLIEIVYIRGNFDFLLSPKNSLSFVNDVPLFIIHSKEDSVVTFHHSESLVNLYKGPVDFWFPNFGSHGKVWDTNQIEYESKVQNFIQKNITH
ncbi:alpha/beta hydrolase [Leptospira biflexa]|uniref:Putative hydrolase, alpha/beta superfamily n=1 Tax=Leptospira biflexa serovar Patoc (strain Patoc 1 / ATCC 23582 / Paris) TaxID=456481 RepID=B0SNR8_LEPBP|nr:alpha/beta fold hydrolase [Leptospira biflexa]ABZ97349.1 Putative hydrolase, alpha/beta superfamily [Leptospira biflexa serovar Patoc strain 'Patoc 1 (Paris)']